MSSIAKAIVGNVPSRPFSAQDVYNAVLLTYKSFPLLVPVLLTINAPFGRFAIESNALNVDGTIGWIIMEVVAPIVFSLSVSSPSLSILKNRFRISDLFAPSWSHFSSLPSPNKILAVLFVTHYTWRAVVQPLVTPKKSPMHISVPLSAIIFNSINGFLMGSWIGGRTSLIGNPVQGAVRAAVKGAPSIGSWFSRAKSIAAATPGSAGPGLIPATLAFRSPLFYLGLTVWLAGFAANIYHDEILANLRRPDPNREGPSRGTRSQTNGTAEGKNKYAVPHGGLYEYISYPNYLTEWLEWSGYALAALAVLPAIQGSTAKGVIGVLFSAPPFLFVVVEIAVMLPRAINGHKWYHSQFGLEGDGKSGTYPKERKAILPFVL